MLWVASGKIEASGPSNPLIWRGTQVPRLITLLCVIWECPWTIPSHLAGRHDNKDENSLGSMTLDGILPRPIERPSLLGLEVEPLDPQQLLDGLAQELTPPLSSHEYLRCTTRSKSLLPGSWIPIYVCGERRPQP